MCVPHGGERIQIKSWKDLIVMSENLLLRRPNLESTLCSTPLNSFLCTFSISTMKIAGTTGDLLNPDSVPGALTKRGGMINSDES